MITIVIAGGNSGIGLQIAHRLVEQGHRVLLLGRDPANRSRPRPPTAWRWPRATVGRAEAGGPSRGAPTGAWRSAWIPTTRDA